jgi:hypothetical protein
VTEDPTPSNDSGWTPEKIESARRRLRRQGFTIVAVLLVGGCVYSMRPQYTVVQMASGRSYKVLSVRQNSEGVATTNCGIHGWSELTIVYSAARNDSTLARDADELTALADRAVSETGDSLLVVSRSTPIISPWIPLSITSDVHYRHVAGRWVSAEDGPWPPWLQCGAAPPSKPLAS